MTTRKFLAVDDERLAREELESALREAVPECELYVCASAKEAVGYAKEHPVDIAFLDIELGAISGIILAKQLKDLQPDIHIIFVTGYSRYAVDAFSIHATGYLLKPVRTEQILRELTFIYKGGLSAAKRVAVRTFGEFTVTVDGKELSFSRSKSKELLALLVNRYGAGVTLKQACSVLFEGTPYDRAVMSYYHTVLASLRSTLKEAGVEDILIRSYNRLAVDVEKIDCDYYRFMDGDVQTVNSYHGEFLPEYSWAEFSAAQLTADMKAYFSENRPD